MSDESNKPNIHIGGDVKGKNVIIGSTQTIHGDLTISMGGMPAASEDVRETLQAQIKDLLAELEKQSAEHTDQVQEIKLAAEDAVTEADKPEPDKQRLQIRGENLVKAAKNLLAVAPIAVKIAETLLRVGG
jgi:hypothetical protein